MKNVYDVAKVVLLFLILTVMILGAFGTKGAASGVTEYKADEFKGPRSDWVKHIDELAKEGWELHTHEDFKYSSDRIPTRFSVLKRRK